jgi:hypothetical protein
MSATLTATRARQRLAEPVEAVRAAEVDATRRRTAARATRATRATRAGGRAALALGLGRVTVSEKEAPICFANRIESG